jgi:hypothetical protein
MTWLRILKFRFTRFKLKLRRKSKWQKAFKERQRTNIPLRCSYDGRKEELTIFHEPEYPLHHIWTRMFFEITGGGPSRFEQGGISKEGYTIVLPFGDYPTVRI